MRLVAKYPLELLLFLILVYFDIYIFWGTNNSARIVFNLLISLLILIIIAFISFAFREKIDEIRKKFFARFLSREFEKSSLISRCSHLAKLSLLPLFISSIIEFSVFLFFTDEGLIAFGFPFSIYSFVVKRFLITGLIFDMVLYSSLIYYLGIVLTRYKNE